MKKGQGAFEYLMTYGWAILVVIIVGIVLWKTGLFGTSATGATGFDVLKPVEWKVTTGANSSILVLRNVAGKTLTDVSISFSNDGNGTANESSITIGPGKEKKIAFNAVCTSGSSAQVDVTINYTARGISHQDTGTIYADCE